MVIHANLNAINYIDLVLEDHIVPAAYGTGARKIFFYWSGKFK